MYNTITKTITFRNYTGINVIKDILYDVFSEILKKYSGNLLEGGSSILEENIREQILSYLHRCAVNGKEFFEVFHVRSEYPDSRPKAVGHIDIQFEEINTKKRYGIELKCHAEYSSSGNGKRNAYDVTARGVHEDISRLEELYSGSGFVILITDEHNLYESSKRVSGNPFLINLRNGKINKGSYIKKKVDKKTKETKELSVNIKNDYTINWEGPGKTKGFILEI